MSGVTWPASLCDLCFGVFFDQIHDKTFFFSAFDQAIDGGRWPASLRRLTLRGNLRHSLNALACVPNLEELCLLPEARSAYGSLLGDIEWPNSLEKLTV